MREISMNRRMFTSNAIGTPLNFGFSPLLFNQAVALAEVNSWIFTD
jgi:hypothetical protein